MNCISIECMNTRKWETSIKIRWIFLNTDSKCVFLNEIVWMKVTMGQRRSPESWFRIEQQHMLYIIDESIKSITTFCWMKRKKHIEVNDMKVGGTKIILNILICHKWCGVFPFSVVYRKVKSNDPLRGCDIFSASTTFY